jgi:Putative  PD-(D/E)XK family member, (DUF4420)
MDGALDQLFASIGPPSGGSPDKPLYAVKPAPAYPRHYIGKDKEALPCLLIATADGTARTLPPIRLESLDVQFDLACHVKKDHEPRREGTFTVIRCRTPERETVRYFLSVCESILRILGDTPSRTAVGAAVNRLAAIFAKLQQPPTRSLNGLFGELFLIRSSGNPRRALHAWRIDDKARFDFSDGDVRLEVKTASNRRRGHSFSYEQCNPPPGTFAVVASLFVERTAVGMVFHTLVSDIEHLLATDADLIFKLHDVIAATLGTGLKEALSVGFDEQLARSSLQLFELDQVPAIRGGLPAGVSEVRFQSDLSAMTPVSPQALIDKEAVFWDLLPQVSDNGE